MSRKPRCKQLLATLPLALLGLSAAQPVAAFNSGSTGADGTFTPTVNTQLQLPADGIFNFTNITIPSGVTVSFAKNATNTPVTLLVSGNASINGTIQVGASSAANVGPTGDGNVGDDGLPGRGGPGGFDGGGGGVLGQTGGSFGLGPGGGGGGSGTAADCGGGGAGYGGNGGSAVFNANNRTFCQLAVNTEPFGIGGSVYGVSSALPLVGGSGGGGGSAGGTFGGSGGGGGGGALLLAVSGTVSVNGAIRANGGSGGAVSGNGKGSSGGGGSGGSIRIVATIIAGNGAISANGGARGSSPNNNSRGGNGAGGRIRLEAETITYNANTSPAFSFATPQDIFVPGLPGLRIIRVAGIDAPAIPTGSADIVLPVDTLNPINVDFVTSGVPLGNTVQLTVTPANALPISTLSGALAGTLDSATASAAVNLPEGPSVFTASVSFTVVAALGDELSRFAQGERVERVELAATASGSETTLITVSGKRYRFAGQPTGLSTAAHTS